MDVQVLCKQTFVGIGNAATTFFVPTPDHQGNRNNPTRMTVSASRTHESEGVSITTKRYLTVKKKEKKAKILVGTNKGIDITERDKKSSDRICRARLPFRRNRASQVSLQFDPNCAGTLPMFAKKKTNCHPSTYGAVC